MLEIIITSSFLILIITALRFALRNKLSPIIIYLLWAVAAVRLLVPISIAETRLSVMNLFERQTVTEHAESEKTPTLPQQTQPNNSAEQPAVQQTPEAIGQGQAENNLPAQPKEEIYTPAVGGSVSENSESAQVATIKTVLLIIWICGALAVMGYIVFTNIKFCLELKKTRRLLRCSNNLPVYVVDDISSPCLFGFIRPCIYLNKFAVEDEQRTDYIIMHELTHYSHRDHIWSIIRVLCTAVYWFNPLVWLAAYLSQHDSELACDSAVMKKVGNKHRTDYGRALLDMAVLCSRSSNIVLTSTTMSSGAKRIKERVVMICQNPKTVRWAAAVLAVAVVAALAVTFTGAVVVRGNAVQVPALEEVDFNNLPEMIYCSIHDRGSDERPYVNEAYISTVRDMQYITNVLEKTKQNPAEIEDIPKTSWLRAKLGDGYYTSFDITNNGYVIEYIREGAQQNYAEGSELPLVWYDTPEIYDGIYYTGVYRIPEEDRDLFIERLENLAAEQQIYDQPGAGEIEEIIPQKISVQVRDENTGELSDIYAFGEMCSARISRSLNICSWNSAGDEEPIDEANHIMRIIFENACQIVDLYSDGHIRLRLLAMQFEENYQESSDYKLLETLPAEEYPEFVEGRLSDSFNTYVVCENVLNGIMDTFELAVAAEGTLYDTTDDITIDEGAEEGFPNLLSEYSTMIVNPAFAARTHNLAHTARLIDGTILQPGEEFSFNETVGERTAERGFIKNASYSYEADSFEPFGGGGVNQVAGTLYNAAFEANLELTERWDHMYAVPYFVDDDGNPIYGIDAAVRWGEKDLRFKNNMEHPIIIRTDCHEGDGLSVRICGVSDGSGIHREFRSEYSGGTGDCGVVLRFSEDVKAVIEGQPGIEATVYEVTYRDGVEISREFAFTTPYSPVNKIIYTDDLPEGFEYDVVYLEDEVSEIIHMYSDYEVFLYDVFEVGSAHKNPLQGMTAAELWELPELDYLTHNVPVLKDMTLCEAAHYKKGEVVSYEGYYNILGFVPELDMLVLSVEYSNAQRAEYIAELQRAGFTYTADDGSGNPAEMCILYNAPENGIGVQFDGPAGEEELDGPGGEKVPDRAHTGTIIFFAQGDGCYGYSDPVPRG